MGIVGTISTATADSAAPLHDGGPFEDSSGYLWAFLFDNATSTNLHAFRSTNGGANWTELRTVSVDGTSRPDTFYAIESSDGLGVHIIMQWDTVSGMSNFNDVKYLYHAFSTGFGSVVTVESLALNSVNDFPCQITELDNGDLVAFYQGPDESIMGTGWGRPKWAVSTNGGTSWTPQSNPAVAVVGQEFHCYPALVTKSATATNLAHFYYHTSIGSQRLYHRAYDTSYGSETDIMSVLATPPQTSNRVIYHDTNKMTLLARSNSTGVNAVEHTDAKAIGTRTFTVETTLVNGSGDTIGGASNYYDFLEWTDGKWFIVYKQGQNIKVAIKDGTWQTPVVVVADTETTSVNDISAEPHTHVNNGFVGIFFEDIINITTNRPEKFATYTPSAGNFPVVVEESNLATQSDASALTEHAVVAVQQSTLGLQSDQVTITEQAAVLTPLDSLLATQSDQVTLTPDYSGDLLSPQGSKLAVKSDTVTATAQGPWTVAPQDSLLALQSDAVSLTEYTSVVVAESLLTVAAEEAVLVKGYDPPKLWLLQGSVYFALTSDGWHDGNYYSLENPSAYGSSWRGLAVDPDESKDRFYVTNNFAAPGSLFEYRLSDGVEIGEYAVTGTPTLLDCSFDLDGKLWVRSPDGANHKLINLNPDNGAIITEVFPGYPFTSFGFDHHNDLWIYYGEGPSNEDKIRRLTFPGLTLLDEIAASNDRVDAFASARDGRMYVFHDPNSGAGRFDIRSTEPGIPIIETVTGIDAGLSSLNTGSWYPSAFGGLKPGSAKMASSSDNAEFGDGLSILAVQDSLLAMQSDTASVGTFELFPQDASHTVTSDGDPSLTISFQPGFSLLLYAQGPTDKVTWQEQGTGAIVAQYDTGEGNGQWPTNAGYGAAIQPGTNRLWLATFNDEIFWTDSTDPELPNDLITLDTAGLGGGNIVSMHFHPNTENLWVLYEDLSVNPSVGVLIEVNLSTGARLTTKTTDVEEPAGLAITHDNEFWVSSQDANDDIHVVNISNGNTTETINIPSTGSPQHYDLTMNRFGVVTARLNHDFDFYDIYTGDRTVLDTYDGAIGNLITTTEFPLPEGTMDVRSSTLAMSSDEVTITPSNQTFQATASVSGVGTATATLGKEVVYGESYCNLAMDFQMASLEITINPGTQGGGAVTSNIRTISFDMRQPFLLTGQPYHPHAGGIAATTSTATGTVIAPSAPETYVTGATTPTERWIVKDASISGGENGGAQFNYVTTWAPESGNPGWEFTSPGFPYRPFYGAYQYGGDNRPYKVRWNNALSFAGRYDEFMQLNQTIPQPCTWMIVTWQIKLSGTASSYPIFNRFPVDVSPYGFGATVDPDFGYRIFERGTMELTVGNTATEFTGLKDFNKEAVYTFVFDGSNSFGRYRDHDQIRQRAVAGGTGSSDGMIIGGSGDKNFLMFVPEVLYFNSVLSDGVISAWENLLFNSHQLGNLANE